jgi:hypothetical protein
VNHTSAHHQVIPVQHGALSGRHGPLGDGELEREPFLAGIHHTRRYDGGAVSDSYAELLARFGAFGQPVRAPRAQRGRGQ